jgi:two-component sensor histidine kinase
MYLGYLGHKFMSVWVSRPRRRDTGKDDKMSVEYSSPRANSLPIALFKSTEYRTAASYERELTRHRRTEVRLRQALAQDEALLSQKDELIQQQAISNQESDHRLLNGLQMIVGLLSLQSRASTNAEAASQLAAAADRIATIGRIHHHLHSLDGVKSFGLRQYLEDLCRDFSMMLSSARPDRVGRRRRD